MWGHVDSLEGLPGGVRVIGVDPGGKSTGVVAVYGRTLSYSALCTRTKGQTFASYGWEVIETIETAASNVFEFQSFDLFVEDVVHPNPHLGLANVTGLMDTARLIGFIQAAGMFYLGNASLHMVRPAGFGGNPLAEYPSSLIGDREKLGTGG